MTDIELPPLPEKKQLANPYAHSFGSVTAYGHTDDTLHEYARAYAAIATAAKDAEIQRLRAEVEEWKVSFHQAAEGHSIYAERAERLAEALECLIIGACAVAVPHDGERAVLQDAVNIARATLAAYRKGGAQ